MNKRHSALAIANYFIGRSIDENVVDMTHMKLQKLAYFAHAWHLAFLGKPLIGEGIQAWQYGPVIEGLYHEFKSYGESRIVEKAKEMHLTEEGLKYLPPVEVNDSEVVNVLDAVWKQYAKYTSIQLSNITHQDGTPWKEVIDKYPESIPKQVVIPDELIEKYYKEKLKKGGEHG